MARREKIYRHSNPTHEYFDSSDLGQRCPVCLRDTHEFDRHHVLMCLYGGTDDGINLLDICKTCHAIITWGECNQAFVYGLACHHIQQAKYGLRWVLYLRRCYGRSKATRDKYEEISSIFRKNAGWGRHKLHEDLANSATADYFRFTRAIRQGHEAVDSLCQEYCQEVGISQ